MAVIGLHETSISKMKKWRSIREVKERGGMPKGSRRVW